MTAIATSPSNPPRTALETLTQKLANTLSMGDHSGAVTDRLMDPNRDHLMDPVWDRLMAPF